MSVAVVKTDMDRILGDLGSALEKIGYEPSNERIMIKTCCASPGGSVKRGDHTDPRVIEAFVRLFPDHDYKVVEGCSVGMSFEKSTSKHGYVDLARRLPQVELVWLENEGRREIPWVYGSVEVPEMLFDHEYVNIPSMKTHMQTTVTLGVKNQKGLLKHNTKKSFHRGDLDAMIRAFGEAVQPGLTIIDGIVGCQGNWPQPLDTWRKKAGVIVCGKDMFETDRAACRVMGFDPAWISHIGEGLVEYVEEGMEDIREPFRPPSKRKYWKALRFYADVGDVCTGCPTNLGRAMEKAFLSSYALLMPYFTLRTIWFGILKRTYWIMGVNPEEVEPGRTTVICIGDCVRDYASEHDHPFIPGCPPSEEAIFKGLLLSPRVPSPPSER